MRDWWRWSICWENKSLNSYFEGSHLVGLGGRENQRTHHWRYYYPFVVLFIPPLGLQSTEGNWGHICWDCWRLVYILLNMFYLLILWWRSVTGAFLHISSMVEEAVRAPARLQQVEGCGWVLVYALTWTWIRKATGHTGFQWFGPGVRFELWKRAQGLLLVLKLKGEKEREEGERDKSSHVDEKIYIDLQNCLWRVIVGEN